MKNIGYVSAIVGGLFAAACVGPKTVDSSLPQIESHPLWQVQRQELLHVPSGQSLAFAPLNHPANRADSLFIWTSSIRARDRLLIPISAVKLRYRDREYSARGWECPPAGQPIRPRGEKPIEYLDSTKGCVLLQFEVSPPEIHERFSLLIQELRIGDLTLVPPEIHFAPGQIQFRGGFQ